MYPIACSFKRIQHLRTTHLTVRPPTLVSRVTEEMRKRVNAIFSKFLKRYLGLPYGTHNSLVHYVTGTVPLCSSLETKVGNFFLNIQYPSCMDGIRLQVPRETFTEYVTVEHIPTFFWLTPPIQFPLPNNPELRRAILYDHFDLHHRLMCEESDHHTPAVTCVCRHCGYSAERFHFRRCPAVMFKSSCGRMKFLLASQHGD